MINDFFVPALNNVDVDDLWFQQDFATSNETINLLKVTLGELIFPRRGPVAWLKISCEFTPLVHFLWSYVKALVYVDNAERLAPWFFLKTTCKKNTICIFIYLFFYCFMIYVIE